MNEFFKLYIIALLVLEFLCILTNILPGNIIMPTSLITFAFPLLILIDCGDLKLFKTTIVEFNTTPIHYTLVAIKCIVAILCIIYILLDTSPIAMYHSFFAYGVFQTYALMEFNDLLERIRRDKRFF